MIQKVPGGFLQPQRWTAGHDDNWGWTPSILTLSETKSDVCSGDGLYEPGSVWKMATWPLGAFTSNDQR